MTPEQLETALIRLPIDERLRLAHFLLSSILESKPNDTTHTEPTELEYALNSTQWLTLSEKSFDFWQNDEDAYYDNL